MDRKYFFGSFSLLYVYLSLIVMALILLFSAEATLAAKQNYKVYNVKNVVRLDRENEKEYKDYLVDFGAESGAKVGRSLKVHRNVIKRSRVTGVSDKLINVPIGTLKIIAVEKDSCVARLVSVNNRESNPLVEYDIAMIGDNITPITEPIKKAKAPDEVMILPETILFDFDKYHLRREAKDALNKIADKINKGDYKKIEIATHTDSIGSDDYNRKLSEKRADSIYNYFVKNLGLNKGLFSVKGYGESRPITSNKTTGDRQKNRRGELSFYK